MPSDILIRLKMVRPVSDTGKTTMIYIYFKRMGLLYKKLMCILCSPLKFYTVSNLTLKNEFLRGLRYSFKAGWCKEKENGPQVTQTCVCSL